LKLSPRRHHRKHLHFSQGGEMRIIARTAFFIVAVCRLGAQPQVAPPTFDVASVKPHPASQGPGTAIRESPGSIDYTKVSLLNIIRRPYSADPSQIIGPAWINTETYDLVAKLPANTALSQMQLMLQRLLAERFGLVLHREKKEIAAYELAIGKRYAVTRGSAGGTRQMSASIVIRPGGRTGRLR
jgi:hypothetical protein